MAIIFWICAILLILCAFAGYTNRGTWAYPGAFFLTVVCLVLLGMRVFAGALH